MGQTLSPTSHIDSKIGFGETIKEPLTVEQIIREAFANPDRKRYPGFMEGYWKGYTLCDDSVDAEAILTRIKSQAPISEAKFNQA